MARSFFGKTREAQGVMPAMGVKAEIEEIERSETGENSQTPGCLMYVVSLRVVEPPEYRGFTVRDWLTIGTKDDKRAKRAETWERSEAGPGRLLRLLKRAGVPEADDDEEWMSAAENQEVCLHVVKRKDENGEDRNRVGLYFRESDPDFIGIGEELEDTRGSGGRRKAKPGRDDDKKARGGKGKAGDDDDDDDKEDDDKKGKKGKDDDDDDAGEDDDAKPARRSARGKGKRGGDDDED